VLVIGSAIALCRFLLMLIPSVLPAMDVSASDVIVCDVKEKLAYMAHDYEQELETAKSCSSIDEENRSFMKLFTTVIKEASTQQTMLRRIVNMSLNPRVFIRFYIESLQFS
jgi:hypothetical protein